MPEDVDGVRYSLQDHCYASSPGKHYVEDENYQSMLCPDSECSRRLAHIASRRPHRCACGHVWDDSQTSSGQIRYR